MYAIRSYYEPLVKANHKRGERDNTINLIKSQYNLCTKYEEMYDYTAAEASHLISLGRQAELMDGIMARYT